MKKVSLINGFLSSEECSKYIAYIDGHLDSFLQSESGDKWQMAMGKDNTPLDSIEDMSQVSDIELELREIFERVELITEKVFNNSKKVYVSNLVLAKQLPGATVPAHYDQDSGYNPQCKYSAVIYLNDMHVNGELHFINFNHSIKPSAGDLVIFPSDEEYLHEVAEISEVRYTLPIFMTDDPSYKL